MPYSIHHLCYGIPLWNTSTKSLSKEVAAKLHFLPTEFEERNAWQKMEPWLQMPYCFGNDYSDSYALIGIEILEAEEMDVEKMRQVFADPSTLSLSPEQKALYEEYYAKAVKFIQELYMEVLSEWNKDLDVGETVENVCAEMEGLCLLGWFKNYLTEQTPGFYVLLGSS